MSIYKTSQRLISSTNVVIVGAKRTPVGSFMGYFKDLSAPHLGTVAARGALASCELDPKEVQELYFGAVMTGGMGQAPDR
jgi:acetyl-CoA C-acetyltransferase